MSDLLGSAPSDLSGLGLDLARVKRWRPDAQAKFMARVRETEQQQWAPFYCTNRHCNGQPHVWPTDERECPNPYGHEWFHAEEWQCLNTKGETDDRHCGVVGVALDKWLWHHARSDQWPPRWKDDWLTLFMRGGRGSGKTRTGSEITNRVTKLVGRITLIGSTGPDFRTFMIEGDSGILATSPPGERPIWEPSKKQLTWPNGCIALGYSAEEPDRLRGQNSGFVWADEPAHWPLVQACWDNMLFGLRKGEYPKIVATSTPKPIAWVKEQLKDEHTIDRVVSTYANLSNLSPVYRRTVVGRFEGTRQGAQELHGEVLEDVEGSLWKWEHIHYRPDVDRDDMLKIAVAIDPAGTANKKSDETGIIVVGLGHDKNYYVFGDYTGKYSPEQWGSMSNNQYREWQANALVPERNYGEDMVIFVLRNTLGKSRKDLMPAIKAVRSRRGKAIRAEPVVALYEKKKVFHVGQRGDLIKLDEELTSWVPGEGASPNRLDALVHGITWLGVGGGSAEVASPSGLRNRSDAVPGLGRGHRSTIASPR